MKKLLCLSLFMSTLFFFYCKQNSPSQKTNDPSHSEVVMTPFAPSHEFPDVSLSSMTYLNGTFEFGISGNYQLGMQTPDAPQKMCANSDKGQHIHLIVDNKPYEAKYTPSFDFPIDSGEHYILAFLSRSYHESIKTKAASALVLANIAQNTFTKVSPVTQPMIFYSRPKGTYLGAETKKIMLDFYLANCNLGPNYKVKADINGKEFVIDTWQPYYLEGLPMGENTIKLSLIDSLGALVNVPLNPVDRKFTLQSEPQQQ